MTSQPRVRRASVGGAAASPFVVSTITLDLDLSVLDSTLKAALATRVSALESTWSSTWHTPGCLFVGAATSLNTKSVTFLELLQRTCSVCPLVLPDGSRPSWAAALKAALASLDVRTHVPPVVALGFLRRTLVDAVFATPELAPLEEQFLRAVSAQAAPYYAWAASPAGIEALFLASTVSTRQWSRHHQLRVHYTERPLGLTDMLVSLSSGDATALREALTVTIARPGSLLVSSANANAAEELTDNVHLHYALASYARTPRTMVLPRGLEPMVRRAARTGGVTCAVLRPADSADASLLETATLLLEDSASTLSAAEALRAARALL